MIGLHPDFPGNAQFRTRWNRDRRVDHSPLEPPGAHRGPAGGLADL